MPWLGRKFSIFLFAKTRKSFLAQLMIQLMFRANQQD
jgi:hypothetical protein